ncbi:hypothetical protein L204_103185 [Cryptococcus depauperatus]|nr:precorrin-2 dehydrogenase/sirohydrochlorin ferrochelatase [Cryptococcus depauperatus CBS 7855]
MAFKKPQDAVDLPATAEPLHSAIQQGASLLLALRLQTRPILLIGGGVVASSRLYFLLEAGAQVTIIAPLPVHPSINHYLSDPFTSRQISHLERNFAGRSDPINVKDFDLVLTAIDDNDLSKEICEMCREARVMINVADIPPLCDFYFGAQMRRGPLQILISTGGMGPRAGAMLRDVISNALPEDIELSLEGVGALRRDLRERAPGVGGARGQKRMQWMKDTCDRWGLGNMRQFNDDLLRKRILDEGWEKEIVLGPEDLSSEKDVSIWRVLCPWIAAPEVQWAICGLTLGATVATFVAFWTIRHRS